MKSQMNMYKRFSDVVAIGEKDECWGWSGKGLPRMRLGNRRVSGMHFGYELLIDKIAKEDVVKPICRNTKCCNPYHARVSSKTDVLRELHSLIDIQENNECWLWKGIVSGGFGRFSWKKHRYMPHRLMYESQYGEIPDDMVVTRLCDNTLCCNPRHMAIKPKWHVSIDNLPIEPMRASAKLDEDDVREIREIYENENISLADLGRSYMVTAPTIKAIVARQIWKHI